MKSAYVIIAHGSRERESNEALGAFIERLKPSFAGKRVEGAFLEIASPSIPEALEKCIRGGATEIFVMPLMFFPGRHVKTDIPRIVQEVKAKHPEVDFHFSSPLCDSPAMVRLVGDLGQHFSSPRKRGSSR